MLAYIHLPEIKTILTFKMGNILRPSALKIVDTNHSMAFGKKTIHDMASNEASGTGNQREHREIQANYVRERPS